MKTNKKKKTFSGFTGHEENLKKLKKTRPDIHRALKNPDPKVCLAWNLVHIRNQKQMTQKDLAHKSGVSLRTINYIEDLNYGYNATLDIIQNLAKALRVGFRDLLVDVDLSHSS